MPINSKHKVKHTRCLKSFVSGFLLISIVLLSACETSQRSDQTQTKTQTEDIKPSSLDASDQQAYDEAASLLDAGEIKKAQRAFEKLDKKYKTHLGSKINLATTYYMQGEFSNAESVCQGALNIDKTSAAAHNLYGLIDIENKRFDSAAKHYLAAIEADKNFANAKYNIALLYDIYFQEIEKAYDYYVAYLKIVPEDEKTQAWVQELQYSLDR